MLIQEIRARVCFNGRGDPGIEAEVTVDGKVGRALSPSGASRGKHEAVPFVDGSPDKTAKLVFSYKKRLIGVDASDLVGLSKFLTEIDGSGNFSRIGGSAAYAISVAAAEAEANARGTLLCRVIDRRCASLPFPLGNIIGGGKHATELSPSIQEILVSPVGARSIGEAVRLNFKVHKTVGELLSKSLDYPVGKGDEGGWSPGISDEQALKVAREAADVVQDAEGTKMAMGVDFAADSLYDEKSETYYYRASKKRLSIEQQIAYASELRDRYNLFYMEDPLHEEDFEGYSKLLGSLKGTLVVGDDLYTTDPERLRRGVESKSTNGVILKVNQIGTLGQACEFASLATKSGQAIAASHRSGDNEGGHLAHFAVGLSCALIKCGVAGGERTTKLNELIRIAEKLRISKMTNLVP